MGDRERLVELLANNPHLDVLYGDEYADAADYLLAHGVTIQRWIPVTEKLPQNPMVRVLVKIKDAYSILGYPDMDTDRYIADGWVRWGENVTHWMPLPEPPKEKK